MHGVAVLQRGSYKRMYVRHIQGSRAARDRYTRAYPTNYRVSLHESAHGRSYLYAKNRQTELTRNRIDVESDGTDVGGNNDSKALFSASHQPFLLRGISSSEA